MKKRILAMLLALCMIVGLLPVVAMAEEADAPTASLTILTGTADDEHSWKPTLSAGMATAYGTNDADGNVSAGTADNWTIKVEWPADGYPVMTMKNAKLVNERLQSSERTIQISGNTDWDILLEGENGIYGSHTANSADTGAGWKGGEGLRVNTTGMLTIKGRSKADSLTIDNNIATCINRNSGPMTIENATVTLQVRALYYTYAAIYMAYGAQDAGVTDLTVRNANFSAYGYRYNGLGIVMGSDPDSTGYNSANVGDIRFENSIVYMQRSGSSGYQTPAKTGYIRTGTGAKFEFDRCDVYLKGSAYVTRYVPTLTNCTTTLDKEAGSEITATFTTISATHTCLAGEPEVLKVEECSTKQATVTKCVVCDKEMSREEVEITDPAKVHTPGAKVELTDKRVAATSQNPGKYVFETTCSICGETWTEEEEFGAGLLHYLTVGNEGNPATNNFNTWGNSGNVNGYTPLIVMNPGEATRYFITTNSHATFTDNYYVSELKDADKIAAGEWTMKLEYPLYGDPVLTLKGAKIVNNAGLWIGRGGHGSIAPMTIKVVEDSLIHNNTTVSAAMDGQNCSAIRSMGTGSLIITGPGKLDISSYLYGNAIINAVGDIIFKDADVYIVKNDPMLASRTCHGIYSSTGNVIFDNSKVMLFSYMRSKSGGGLDSYRGIGYGVFAKKDVVIKNGSNVNVTASLSGTQPSNPFGIYATEDLIISESTMISSHGGVYYGKAVGVGGELVLEFANGYNARTSASKYSYNAETGAITYPTGSAVTGVPTTDNLKAYMFRIEPKAPVNSFAGTSVTVNSSLDVNFAVAADKVTDAATIKFTVGDEEITQTFAESTTLTENGYTAITLPGVAAKEMATKITVTIYDAEGKALTETKSDSVLEYAMRILRDERYAEETEANKALKTALVDMLIYGAMAQVQFEHDTDNLVTAGLTTQEWAYASTEMKPVDATPTQVVGDGYKGVTFILESKIGMAIAIDKAVVGEGATAKVTFTNYEGKSKTVTLAADETYSSASLLVFINSELVAADGRTVVTWEICKAGETEATITVTDSMANYVGRMISKYPYLAEVMKYSDSVKAYFELTKPVAPTE